MSRRKVAPVEQAFALYAALTPEEVREFDAMVRGHRMARGGVATDSPAPARRRSAPKAAGASVAQQQEKPLVAAPLAE